MTAIALSQLLAEGRDPAHPIATSAGKLVPFAQFRGDVAHNAARLREMGCISGLLAPEDGYWAAVGLLALLYVGAKAIMPRSLQTTGANSGDWDCVIAGPPGVQMNPSDQGRTLVLGPGQSTPISMPPLDPANCWLELWTAGSTGAPKRVSKSVEVMEREAEAIEAILGPRLSTSASVHATVPHNHLYGLSFRLIWPLTTGRPFRGRMSEYWESLLGADLLGAVIVTSPAHLTRLSIQAHPSGQQPAIVLSAGAPLPEAAAKEAKKVLGIPVTEIFGSTETGAIAWRDRTAVESLWDPLPGVSVTRLADGRMGVQSPYATEELDEHGRFLSADLIELDNSGSFRFQGRADHIVKIEGKRVSLLEVEEQLSKCELIAEAAIVGLEGENLRLGGVVVLSEAGRQRLGELGSFRFGQQLRRMLAETLDPAGLPRLWRFVESIPVSTLGKRRISDLLALFSANPKSGAVRRVMEPHLRAQRQIDDGVELDLFIPANLAQLEGHFPGLAIVPGVAQVDWAVKYADRFLGLAIDAAKSFQIKFRRVTTANITVTLVLRHRTSRNQLAFEYRSGDSLLTSGAIDLGLNP